MRNRLLMAAVVGVGASALMMACGGDDAFVSPGDEDSGAADATSPVDDAGMGMVVDATTVKDGGDATTGDQDATTPGDANSPVDATGGDSSDAATDAREDASDAEADAADASDASDAADASDASDASDADAGDAATVTFLKPTCDGVISPGEYGPGVQGMDQYATPTAADQVWHMTWDDTNLYIGLEVSPTNHAILLYFNTATGGLTTPPTDYDGIAPSSLGINANLVVYENDTHGPYNEFRTVTGGTWSGPNSNMLTVCDNNNMGTTEEIVIPWSVSAGARPSAFQFFGMAEDDTNGSPGYIYGQMPVTNPSGNSNGASTAPIVNWFAVSDTTPAGAGSAFATIKP